MKKFINRIFFVIVPILIIVVFINYYIDPAHLFSKGYEEKLASEIIKGNNVTNVYNYNERIFQKNIISNSSLCPEIIAIGSSRIMLINSSYFKGKTFFNHGVSGATIQDLLTIIQLYNQKKCFPKKIIIGLDPWTLNINNGQTRWQTLDKEYTRFIKQMPNYSIIQNQSFITNLKYLILKNLYYKELVSPSYFKSSISQICSNNTEFFVTQKQINNTLTKLSDGSINYDFIYRSASKDEVEKRVFKYITGDLYCIENFNEIDENSQSQLEFLISYLKYKNIEIEFLLTPYHPKVYDLILSKEKYKKVLDSEIYFKNIATKNGIKIIGSFNPNNCKLNSSDFYDGMHLNEKGIHLLLNK